MRPVRKRLVCKHPGKLDYFGALQVRANKTACVPAAVMWMKFCEVLTRVCVLVDGGSSSVITLWPRGISGTSAHGEKGPAAGI